MLLNNEEVPKEFNQCFGHITDSLNLYEFPDVTDRTNFRPASVLPLLSTVCERVIYNQLGKYMDTFLNKLLCELRKAHSTQHAIIKLRQRWQKKLDNSGLVTLG